MDFSVAATIAFLVILGYFAYRRIKSGPVKDGDEPESFRDHWTD